VRGTPRVSRTPAGGIRQVPPIADMIIGKVSVRV
jgi:hypothetical protein